jgi:hypothetical protein
VSSGSVKSYLQLFSLTYYVSIVPVVIRMFLVFFMVTTVFATQQ